MQYLRSVAAVFPGAPEVENPFSNSDRSAEFSTNAGLRRFDFNSSQSIRSNAIDVAQGATPGLMTRFTCLAQAEQGCVKGMLTELGRELYREPVGEAELTKLLALFEQARVAKGVDAAAALVVRAMLSSPRFLFQKQLGMAATGSNTRTLTSHEMASSLAYALTNGPPDATLRDAADADKLKVPEQIAVEVKRLLATPGGLDGLENFLSELFRIRDLPTQQKDAKVFPTFDAATRTALQADFADTSAALLRSATPTFEALLTTRQYVVRPQTAALLGWTSLTGLPEEGALSTIPESARAGLFMHPALLATFAHPDESNPVARGHLVSAKLLGVTIPPPPMAVVFPERPADGQPRTLRQVLETQHSADACNGCHQLMDPMGYPFEVFDAVGKLRDTDGGLPIDASGAISGTNEIDGAVQGPSDMLAKIASSKIAHARFTGNAFKYIAGEAESDEIYCLTSGIADKFKASGGNIPELIGTILSSPEFRSRSAE